MRIKYGRTYHFPFSPGVTSDDKKLRSTLHFQGKDVVGTKKMDGENTTLYRDGFHARSLSSPHHPTRDWVARFHASIAHEIPDGWRICGENLYATHSIHYTDLPSYFMGFSVWTEQNIALSWDDSLEIFELLGVAPVPELFRGVYSDALVEREAKKLDTAHDEGLVVRLAGAFHYDDFNKSIAKWVRDNHVTTDKHWMHQMVAPNELAHEKDSK
ncbi:TonB-dependent receptor [Novimethylophilus kurashikiensis]|uniref:TonB-dependent receptor n=1 Tax=Novimethylophilus kurashikiensis TaxID=1825523 RepID=A0A2R5F8A2_9PROT|nr:RNA ligase family protein [Novimethylophilus kurashikiensis]GBG14472.1 TonB-dependent receptor [Novimethylophilus kurashikiensis]